MTTEGTLERGSFRFAGFRIQKLFSIYSTTQECDIIVGQKIVGQKGVETDEKKLSK